MNKRSVALIMSVGLAASMMMPVQAATMEERITALEELVAQQQEQIEELQAVIGIVPEGTEMVETETEELAEPVLKTTEEFLEDFRASYDSREAKSEQYTEAEKAVMSIVEFNDFLEECAEAERPFYEEYKNAVFEDLNIQYLCNQYIQGLAKQYQAAADKKTDPESQSAIDLWQSGYYNRAYVMVELAEYYGLELPAGTIASMKEKTAAMDSLNEAETRNSAVDHETVRRTQELLNSIGFFCGNADGVSGKRTVKSIKRFQEMYGYEPIDGMIDDELIGQLEAVAAEKVPAEEVETETEE